MPKKSEIYENSESKQTVKIQIRPYDSNGDYESLDGDNGTIQVKNVSAKEVMDVVRGAIEAKFGNKK